MDSYIPTWILTRRPEQASPPWFRAAVKEYLALQKLMRYIDADTAWLYALSRTSTTREMSLLLTRTNAGSNLKPASPPKITTSSRPSD